MAVFASVAAAKITASSLSKKIVLPERKRVDGGSAKHAAARGEKQGAGTPVK
jgi:hypothetical protein